MNEIEELQGQVPGGRRKGAVDGVAVVVINPVVLMVQGMVEDAAA